MPRSRFRSRFRSLTPALALAALFAGLALAGPAGAQVELTSIADQETAVPGFPMETFSDFGEGPPVAVETGGAVFYGAYPSGSGIYAGDGTHLVTISDETTPAPEGGGATFDGFVDSPWADIEGAVFPAFVGGRIGLYQTTRLPSDPLVLVVEEGDPVPGSAETFTNLLTPTHSSYDVAFLGEATDGSSGVYFDTAGTLVTVADTYTLIPGGGSDSFASFSGPIASDGRVAFYGDDFGAGRLGIYLGDGGPLTVVADETTSQPGTAATFTSLSSHAFADGLVAFVGASSGLGGIYLGDGGPLVTVVDSTTPRPGGGTFGDFGEVSISQGNVLFQEGDELFFWESGSVQRILGPGDLVDGKTIESIFIGPGALGGRGFTATLEFTDDSIAIYRGEIPLGSIDPSEVPTLGEWGLILLALGLAAAAAFVLRPAS